MNIFSLDKDNKRKSEGLYSKLKDSIEDFYKILKRVERLKSKLKLLGKYNEYVTIGYNGGLVLHRNISEGIYWGDYEVVYLPANITSTDIQQSDLCGPNILFIGPGKITNGILKAISPNKKVIIASSLEGESNLYKLFNGLYNIKDLVIYGRTYNVNHELTNKIRIRSLDNTFTHMVYLERLVMLDFDLSDLSDMDYAFSHCESLKECYIENFETPSLQTMASTFNACTSIKEFDFNLFDTSRVRYMGQLFYSCSLLNTVRMDKINTDNVGSMEEMFMGCINLREISMGNIYIPKLSDSMFKDCFKLEKTGKIGLDTSIKLKGLIPKMLLKNINIYASYIKIRRICTRWQLK